MCIYIDMLCTYTVNILISNLAYKNLNKPKSVLLIKMITCVFWGNLSGRNASEVRAADNLLHLVRNRKLTNSLALFGKL